MKELNSKLDISTISKSYRVIFILLPFCSSFSLHLYFFPPFFPSSISLPPGALTWMTRAQPQTWAVCAWRCVCMHVWPEASSNPLWQKNIRAEKYVRDRHNTLPIIGPYTHTHTHTQKHQHPVCQGRFGKGHRENFCVGKTNTFNETFFTNFIVLEGTAAFYVMFCSCIS